MENEKYINDEIILPITLPVVFYIVLTLIYSFVTKNQPELFKVEVLVGIFIFSYALTSLIYTIVVKEEMSWKTALIGASGCILIVMGILMESSFVEIKSTNSFFGLCLEFIPFALLTLKVSNQIFSRILSPFLNKD